MTNFSPKPDGGPARCPLCQSNLAVEPSVFIGDATCPNCGQHVWFLATPEEIRVFSTDANGKLRDRLIHAIAEHIGVARDKVANNPKLFDAVGADSLDTVELVMELEEEFTLIGD